MDLVQDLKIYVGTVGFIVVWICSAARITWGAHAVAPYGIGITLPRSMDDVDMVES